MQQVLIQKVADVSGQPGGRAVLRCRVPETGSGGQKGIGLLIQRLVVPVQAANPLSVLGGEGQMAEAAQIHVIGILAL